MNRSLIFWVTTVLMATVLILNMPTTLLGAQAAGPMVKLKLIKSQNAKPMANPDRDMQKVLDALDSLHPKPLETLTPAQARMQPTLADAAKLVLKQKGKDAPPDLGVTTRDLQVRGSAGLLPARLYLPKDAQKSDKPLPVIVYYHGGGWVVADLDTYDASARALAKLTNALIVSTHYRQAPEYKFPAAHDDAFAVYQWVLTHAGSFKGDPDRVAVVGESAGGNLAANVSIMARDQGVALPVHQVLIYPVAGTDMTTPSYIENALAKPLNKAMMGWFFRYTLAAADDKQSPMLNLINANLTGLPSTTVITAEIDPLRSEGMALGERLKAAGVEVKSQNYTGVTHEFFGLGGLVNKADDAEKLAADQLKDAFNKAQDLKK